MTETPQTEFDAATADAAAEFFAERSGSFAPQDRPLARALLRALWTFGQLSPIADLKAYLDYAERLRALLVKHPRALGDRDLCGAFLRTRDGAMVLALISRMREWERRAAGAAS